MAIEDLNNDDNNGDNQNSEASGDEQEPSNAIVKSSKLFQKLAGQVAALEQEKRERVEADTEAKATAEEEKLKAEGRFEEALAKRDERIKAMEDEHAADLRSRDAELRNRDIATALYAANFRNKAFIKTYTGEYNAEEHGTPEEYAKALADDEEFKPFLSTFSGDGSPPPPPKPPGKIGSTGATKLTSAQLTAMEKSADPKVQKQARDYLHRYYQEHREFPD